MSVNDKVTIRWLTEDGWKGVEQSFKRRCLMPAFPILWDPGADSGDEEKSKRADNYKLNQGTRD